MGIYGIKKYPLMHQKGSEHHFTSGKIPNGKSALKFPMELPIWNVPSYTQCSRGTWSSTSSIDHSITIYKLFVGQIGKSSRSSSGYQDLGHHWLLNRI